MLSNFYIEDHVKRALAEDIGFGDITTENLSEKIRKYKRLFEEAVKEYQMSQGVLEDSNIPLSKNDKE